MNEVLSFHRIGLLVKNIFIQNWKRDLSIILCVMGGIAIIEWYMGFHYRGMPMIYPLAYNPVNLVISLTLISLSSLVFKQLANPSSSIMYLTTPASTLEKVVVSVLQVHVYYFILLVLSGFLGYILALCLLVPVFPSENVFTSLFYVKLGDVDSFWLLLLTAMASAMMFSSVYFRKRAFLWSSLIIVGIVFVAFVIDMFIVYMNKGMLDNNYHLSESAFQTIYTIAFSITTLFFWFMTWLRLRETEV